MEIKQTNFIPILLGSDINTYSMARAFHEAYKIKSIVLGKSLSGPSCHSRITNYSKIDNLDTDEVFLREIIRLSSENKDKKLIVLGCGDNYLTVITKNKAKLPENVIAPYIEYTQMAELIDKEKFYKLCEKEGIPYPKTFVVRKETGTTFSLPFDFPVILKPADTVTYWDFKFTGQKKVYKIDDRKSLDETIAQIYKSGYKDSLIVQDFIPGDDTNMRVLTCYSDRNKKVTMMALGHVLLEEHTPKGLGNHAVIINEENAPLMEKMKKFLEDIGYVGFSNFDIKYDSRDGTYRVFEINVRQGRSNYYVTAGGCNIAECLVDDRILGKDSQLRIVKNKMLWLVVPLGVALRYVADCPAKVEMKSLIEKGKVINSLFYKGDLGLQRLLYLLRSHFGQFRKYNKYYKHHEN